jgi:alpha-tubulin suppressor-like RCC1 family protein
MLFLLPIARFVGTDRSLQSTPPRAVHVALLMLLVLGFCAGAPSAAQAESGMGHTCVVKTDHTVWCWGGNDGGMLGGSLFATATPVQINSINDATAVTGIGSFACVLRIDETVACWGSNWSGQLGDGTTDNSNTPVTVQGLSDVSQLASGGVSSCAVRTTGTVACWGQNYSGQLGDGTTDNSSTPVEVQGITNAVSVTIQDRHACALLADTTVKCWGNNEEGALGDGTTTNASTPVAVSGLSGVTSLSAGFVWTCATVDDGSLKCWGSNMAGLLGGATEEPYSPVPVVIPGVHTAVQVTSGYQLCARLANSSVMCWGIVDANSYAILANGEGRVGAPALVPGITDAAHLLPGMFSQCAIRTNHKVACWGMPLMGGLGNGQSPILTSPDKPVSGLADVTAIASGSMFSCALRATKAVSCWGVGPFGDGATSPYRASFVPASVPDATDITAFDLGGGHGCAVISGGSVKCLGGNDDGQLGDGTTDDSYLAAVNVTGINDASAVATGQEHSCALRTGGTVWCWGYNSHGQLGDGTTDQSSTPVVADGVNDATQLAAGWDSTCVRITGGAVSCWGGVNSSSHAQDTGTRTATQVTVGDEFACALLADQTVECWGRNDDHQLGDGTTDASTTPVPVRGLSNVTAIDAGRNWACAVLASGSVRCWGSLAETFRPSGATDPTVAVQGLANAVDISVSELTACAMLVGGTATCWGVDEYGAGAFGDGEGPVGHGHQTTAIDVVGLDGVWTGLPDPPTDEPPVDDPPTDEPPTAEPPIDSDPIPNPSPKPPTPRVLPPAPKTAAAVRLVGNKLKFSNYIMASRTRACPRRVTITVRAGSRSVRLHSPHVKRIGKTCRVNGSVTIPKAFNRSKKITARVSGPRLRTRTVVVPRTLS